MPTGQPATAAADGDDAPEPVGDAGIPGA